MSQQTYSYLLKLCLWATIWALGIISIKIIIFKLFNYSLTPEYIIGSALSFLGHAFFGLLLSTLLFSSSKLIRYIGLFFLLFLSFSYLAAFHYEIIFRNLPGASLLYYLKEIRHLAPSIESNIPYHFLLLELFCFILLILLSSFLSSRLAGLLNRSRFIRALLPIYIFIIVLLPFLIHFYPGLIKDNTTFWASRNPVFWLLKSSITKSRFEKNDAVTAANVWAYQKALGHVIPSGGVDLKYPLWAKHTTSNANDGLKDKNILLLILESVGDKEIYSEVKGKPVMPNLKKIAEENLFFRNFYANGTKTLQALPPVLAGVPPQTETFILRRRPLPRFYGLPAHLSQYGYHSIYLHGSDLSFEQKRAFLKMVGFDELFDYDPVLEKKALGWGYDDGVMFSKLKEWMLSNKNKKFFATYFTLSTHDPYVIPESWDRRFSEKGSTMDEYGNWIGVVDLKTRYWLLQESLHFLDDELGKFYNWFIHSEFAKDTLLVMLGDHVPSLYNESPDISENHMRFKVPLIWVGLSEAEKKMYRNFSNRLSTQFDFPATLTNYMRVSPLPLAQGIDLFMPDSKWPDDRLIYSVGGHELERVYLWTKGAQAVFDKYKNKVGIINYELPENPGNAVEGKKANDILSHKFVPFLKILYPLNHYLLAENAYAPETAEDTNIVQKKSDREKPVIAFFQGNAGGTQKKSDDNKTIDIEAAIRSGFEWVNVNVALSKDSVPILFLKEKITTASRKEVSVEDLTLKELRKLPGYEKTLTLEDALSRYLDKIGFIIELKPPHYLDRNYILNRKIIDLISNHPLKHKIIIDSVSDLISGFIKNRCDCMVGINTRQNSNLSPEVLLSVRQKGMDWIFIHHSIANTSLIREIHDAGLKVMLYPVDSRNQLSGLKDAMPDGILTNNAEVLSFSR